ncbi:hypothetical protein [Shouchella shacheensis]|uniref:hypothetical protein n=1 Tax=Shouchella shacheensis TaxID=1649580 RepID=UPI00073FE3B9|nr:hypothetical protein [Shouchella shacheensis]
MSQRQPTNTQDRKHIQLQQKLLHYRSEVVKQERILKQQTKKLDEQELVIHGLTDRLEELAKRPAEVEYRLEAKDEQRETPPQTSIIVPYFSYSIISPIDLGADEPVLIKGHFVLENKGEESLHDPVVCLTFNKPQLANLSGRIHRPDSAKKKVDDHLIAHPDSQDGWSYLEKEADKRAKESGQFWLKPQTNELPASSSMAFSNFEIMLPVQPSTSVSLQVNGFVYGQEYPDGVPSLNAITFTLA